MPYEIRHKDGKWCVYNTEKHENKGCSKTKSKAVAHMRLLEGIEHGNWKPTGKK